MTVQRLRLVAGIAVAIGAFNSGVGSSLVAPASRFPILWRLGKIDPRFNVDFDQVKKASERAVHVWEAESGRRLFAYDANRGFPVNLVFDGRQMARNARRDGEEKLLTSKLVLAQAERTARESLDRSKRADAQVDADSDAYESRLEAYNRRVESWNAAGGAPPEIVARLDAEKAGLASEKFRVRQSQQESDALREDANSRVGAYNDAIDRYNRAVEEFNHRFGDPIGERIGECLMSGTRAKSISIYAFQDLNHLAVVLTHEFGHALGLSHVRGDGALMSAVETGDGLGNDLRVTERDRDELRRALRR